PPANLDERLCPGCKRSAVTEQGGLVVAFGQSFFHVDCFKCAKCGDQVTADTNLLLLSDGSPICANCSYSCNVCHNPILDEAIMTGDDSYHAHCFKCKVCKNRIEELVFAKTSQGIYCMKCHNERMIKIRKHTQKKAEREKAAAAQGSTSSREHDSRYRSQRSNPVKKNTLPLPSLSPSEGFSQSRRRSFDDGVRPLNALFPREDLAPPKTSRQDKRRSINPGLMLNSISSSGPSSPVLSSLPATNSRPSTPRDPSRTPSPRPEHHPRPSSRPDSASSSPYVSSSSTPQTPSDRDFSQDQTVVMSPNSRPDVILDSVPQKKPSRSASRSKADDRLSATFEGRRSSDERPPSHSGRLSSGGPRPSSQSRSDTPSSRRADVPHSIESGTDTDPEGDALESTGSSPPPPPPKELKSSTAQPPPQLVPPFNDDADASATSQLDSSDDMSESSPVERTSHSTYIAPALPPIRFSMTTADFSDLFKSVDGQKQTMKQLADISEDLDGQVPMTPPPTAASVYSTGSTVTPTSDATFTAESQSSRAASEEGSSATDDNSVAESTRLRSSSESQSQPTARITVTRAESAKATLSSKNDQASMVILRLQDALADARERGAQQLKLDRAFVEAILGAVESRDAELSNLKGKFDGVKRASKQYIDGLTVAQTEYDSELKARREAEAEVTRLRVLVSGQAARLTALSGDTRRHELRQQLSRELNDNLSDLEQDLSKLRVERDMALAEVEELSATKQFTTEVPSLNLGRSLTLRLDTIKKQYQRDLIPLRQERETLAREVMELKGVRDVFLEETTVLNARNEELAQLSAQYARKMVPLPETPSKTPQATPVRPQHSAQQASQYLGSLTPSVTGSSASDDTHESRFKIQVEAPTPSKVRPVFKWPGSRVKEPIATPSPAPELKQKVQAHNFQQLSVLRFTRCDHCGDKMWGSQLRCTGDLSVHFRCANHVQVSCSQDSRTGHDEELPPSLFGRDLIEQVHADAIKGGDRQVPVIVEKCIDAVETLALDYEGIYRKSGGSGQSKVITQLFERGDYTAFDLCDSDRFNDICSVTSVLKTYFRSLPIPLLTYELHNDFISAVQIRELPTKNQSLLDLVNRLPVEHYCTLRRLMVHLYRIHQRCEKNLMTARNLGVVFGPTLMRSPDPSAEFSDMAGKALSVEWFIENAPHIFPSS
ncbi:signal transducer, partial [Mycena pura]